MTFQFCEIKYLGNNLVHFIVIMIRTKQFTFTYIRTIFKHVVHALDATLHRVSLLSPVIAALSCLCIIYVPIAICDLSSKLMIIALSNSYCEYYFLKSLNIIY